MPDRHDVRLLDPAVPGWADEIDRLRAAVGAPCNPALFPAHFLKASFAKMGGRAVEVCWGPDTVGVGFLFPRGEGGGLREYTLRYHGVPGRGVPDEDLLLRWVGDLVPGGWWVWPFYDPEAPSTFSHTSRCGDGLDIGQPNAAESAAVRELQRAIWGSDDDLLYPTDLHAEEFAPASSLVARVDGRPVGFLLAFGRFDDGRLPAAWARHAGDGFWLESQVLGVLPEHRGRGVAWHLKAEQGRAARRDSFPVVTWTVDPLLWGNALLNFGRLRAVATGFVPDFYPVRNALNRVRASRLEVTWLVGTERVARVLDGGERTDPLDLAARPDVPRLNDGPRLAVSAGGARTVAVEVPADWTGLGRDDPAGALAWREGTDAILDKLVGTGEGRYLVTGVGRDGERRFLVAERADAGLLEALGR